MKRYFVSAVNMRPLEARSYLSGIPAIRYLEREGTLALDHDVTFFIGENGTGKSTLLEALAVAAGFNAEGGSRGFRFATRNSTSDLHDSLTLVREKHPRDGYFLRAESFYNVATQVEQLDVGAYYGPGSLHEQSHGESFLALVQNRFYGRGLYLLDEPEAALSPLRQMTLLAEIHRLAAEEESQFIIATHSPILLAYPGAQIYQFSEDGITAVAYKDCEPYRLTLDFLTAPERFLVHLFSEVEDE
ncbi:MAG: AAA family ATPase [Clostridia bacterium]|nr:AAA family ATPase [Clostridia bacterium]